MHDHGGFGAQKTFEELEAKKLEGNSLQRLTSVRVASRCHHQKDLSRRRDSFRHRCLAATVSEDQSEEIRIDLAATDDGMFQQRLRIGATMA